MELYLISALVFGVLTSLLAKQKQKNPFHWFFIGFVSGVFGLAAILILKKSTGFKSYRAYSIDPELIKEKIKENNIAKKSPQLAYAGEFEDDLLPQESDVDIVTCPNCRTLHSIETKNCPICDTKFFA